MTTSLPVKVPPYRFPGARIRPWGLLNAAGIVLSSATVLALLGSLSWLTDLFSHFRVQYALGLIVVGGLCWAGRRRRNAAIFLTLAGFNLAAVAPLYFGPPDHSTGVSPVLRAMLINVNARLGDAKCVKAAVEKAQPDILILEEITDRWMSELAGLTNMYPHARAQPRRDTFGIGLFSKLPLTDAQVVNIGTACFPSIIATVQTASNQQLRVVATHPRRPGGPAYTRQRDDQLEQLPGHLPSGLPLLLIGDLNLTPWNDHFRRLLERTGLRDSTQGFGIQPTWPNGYPLFGIPLDHCLHSPDITIVDRRIGESVSSDHYPLIVDFAIGHTDGRRPMRGGSSQGQDDGSYE